MTECTLDLADFVTHFASLGASFLGATSFLVYLPAKTVKEAVTRIAVSTLAGAILAPAITTKIFDDSMTDVHVVASVAFGVGFIAFSALGAVARYFDRRRDKDAMQMYEETK